MAVLEVLKYPDPRLRHKALPVDKVTDELRKLASDMLETMYAENGIGLASIQVGVEKRLLVIDITPMTESDRYDLSKMTELEKKVAMPLVIFNPVITKKDGKTTYEEGCLSVPGYFETVQRANHIEVTGIDLENKKMHLELDGLLAICMQHEIDHLDGKVFLDRLSPIKSARLKNRIKKYGYTSKKEDGEDSSEDGKNEL